MGNNLKERLSIVETEIEAIKKELSFKKFQGLTVGDTFQLIGVNWRILDITGKGYLCLAEIIDDSMRFGGESNDWKSSGLRGYLNGKILHEIAEEIGADNVIPFERDLISLDGQTEYGKCTEKVSLISLDQYRKYRKLIPNSEKYWWTLTPDSTKGNDDSRWVLVVSPPGYIGSHICVYDYGVRPFCIFSSALFES